MRIIGLTGGIASGKSTVAGFLGKYGATVIDADQLARRVVMPGSPAHGEIVAAFGEGILQPDGTIDRKELGRIVFADPEARRLLERITHPAIRELAEEELANERRKGTEIVFYMAPLLIEAGVASRCDEVWVVYADEETQLERLVRRDGIGREEARRRMATQLPMEEKVKMGNAVIDNRGRLQDTEGQVRRLWEGLPDRSR